MGSLNAIVTVNITTTGAQAQAPGFGVPLIADYHTKNADLIRWYTSLDGMLSDGFAATDAAYRAAAACFAQTPSPSRVAIGRRQNAPDLTIELTPVAANTRVYSVDLLGPTGVSATASFTSDGTASVAEIAAGLMAAINSAAVGITATGGVTSVVCKASTPGLNFSVVVADTDLIAAQQTHADPGITADLAAIKLVSSDFYGVTLTTCGKAETIAAAAWVEANERLGVFSSQDEDIKGSGTTDVASEVKGDNQFRSWVCYSRTAQLSFRGAAILGATLAKSPGSVTFKFLRLAGQTSDTLSETALTNMNSKNAGWFTDFSEVAITGEGKSAAGEWMDFIRDRDWFRATMQTDVYNALIAAGKKPYTDAGIQSIASVVRADLSKGVSSGFLTNDPAPSLVVPAPASVSTADRNARRLTGMRFTATTAGAIHAVVLNGNIS